MSKFIDLTGKKFGRLIVIKRVGSDKNKQAQWLCECECGNNTIVISRNLTKGCCKSCGCLRKELLDKRGVDLVSMNTSHGDSHTRLYHIWANMKQRCTNPNHPSFSKYGERGIKVCSNWYDDYTVFKKWAIDNGYKDDLTLDRRDNNGNYEPSNCRWVTMLIQGNNKSNNRLLAYNNQTKTISEWAKELGYTRNTLNDRIIRGWSIEKALETPIDAHKSKFKTLTYNGKTQTILEWSKELGIPRLAIYNRLRYGWSIERTLETPIKKR